MTEKFIRNRNPRRDEFEEDPFGRAHVPRILLPGMRMQSVHEEEADIYMSDLARLDSDMEP